MVESQLALVRVVKIINGNRSPWNEVLVFIWFDNTKQLFNTDSTILQDVPLYIQFYDLREPKWPYNQGCSS